MATTSDGTITSFSTTKTQLDIDGIPYTVETAGRRYSLTNPDAKLCASKFNLVIRPRSVVEVVLIAQKFKTIKSLAFLSGV
jgi:hypothetical protein